MAKTRIKTTPMRIHKDALMAIATAATNEQSKQKKSPAKLQRLNCTRSKQKQQQLTNEPPHTQQLQPISNNGQQHRTTTIIMPKSAYTTITSSSAFASMSQTSDTQSVNSGTESPTAVPTPSPPPPPPPPPPAAAAITQPPPLTTQVGDYITHFSEPQEILTTHASTLTPAMNQLNKFNASHQPNQVLLEATTAAAVAKPPSAFSKLLQNATNNMNLTSNGDANRKVYMITADDVCTNGTTLPNGQQHGQKRKMLLIMEENTAPNGNGYEQNYNDTGYGNGDVQSNGGGAEQHAAHNLPPMKKKLTLFANKSDRDLTQKFEKILPEIISRIHAKTSGNGVAVPLTALRSNDGNAVAVAVAPKVTPAQQSPQFAETVMDNGRLPLTLPPKKNRTKIITTSQQLELLNDNAQHYQQQPAQPQQQTQHQENYPIIQISAATPVIVENSNLIHNHKSQNHSHTHNHIHNHNHNLNRHNQQNIKTYAVHHSSNNGGTAQQQMLNCNGSTVLANKNVVIVATGEANASTQISHNSNMGVLMTAAEQHQERKAQATTASSTTITATPSTTLSSHKNINLSTDFLFLMKMLPKLESIPEPNKAHVKNYIEQIITQNLSN